MSRRIEMAPQVYWEESEKPVERCCRCNDPTCIEVGFNSFFRGDNTGPYCETCFNLEPVVEAIQDANQEAGK